jgi:hypothetical protein
VDVNTRPDSFHTSTCARRLAVAVSTYSGDREDWKGTGRASELPWARRSGASTLVSPPGVKRALIRTPCKVRLTVTIPSPGRYLTRPARGLRLAVDRSLRPRCRVSSLCAATADRNDLACAGVSDSTSRARTDISDGRNPKRITTTEYLHHAVAPAPAAPRVEGESFEVGRTADSDIISSFGSARLKSLSSRFTCTPPRPQGRHRSGSDRKSPSIRALSHSKTAFEHRNLLVAGHRRAGFMHFVSDSAMPSCCVVERDH